MSQKLSRRYLRLLGFSCESIGLNHLLAGLVCTLLCGGAKSSFAQNNPDDLLRQSPNGIVDINYEYVNQLYSMNRDSGIKNYLPHNITAKDTQSSVAQKFLAQATDQFVQAHKQDYAATVKTVESLNVQEQMGESNFSYQAKILQGKAAMDYKGNYFLTTLSYDVHKNTIQLEMSRLIEKTIKVSVSQTSDSQQNLSKVVLAYDF